MRKCVETRIHSFNIRHVVVGNTTWCYDLFTGKDLVGLNIYFIDCGLSWLYTVLTKYGIVKQSVLCIGPILPTYIISWPHPNEWRVFIKMTLQWRYNGRDGVSNHQPHDCLLTRLFRHRLKKILELRITGLCVGNSPGTGEFPAQRASNTENVFIWWSHHDIFEDAGN